MREISQLCQGDIVWLDFDPQAGHEQMGRRPALIVSNTDFNKTTLNSVFVCPITNTDRKYPLHIQLPESCSVTGFVMCEQLKGLDIKIRNAEFADKIDEETMWQVSDAIQGIIELA